MRSFVIIALLMIALPLYMLGQGKLNFGVGTQGYFSLPSYPSSNNFVKRTGFGHPAAAFPVVFQPELFVQYELSSKWAAEACLSVVSYKTTYRSSTSGEPGTVGGSHVRQTGSFFNPVVMLQRQIAENQKLIFNAGFGARLAMKNRHPRLGESGTIGENSIFIDSTYTPLYRGLYPVISAGAAYTLPSGNRIGLRLNAQYGYMTVMEHNISVADLTATGMPYLFKDKIVHKGSYISLELYYSFCNVLKRKSK